MMNTFAFNNYIKIALLLWLLVIIVSVPVFWYIANNPSTLLFIEATQPAQGVQRGLDLLKQNKVDEAIHEMKRALAFWQNLSEESGQRSHQIHLAHTYSALATVLANHGTLEQKQQALDYFHAALDIDPSISHGQPWVNLGDLLLNLNQYEEAIEAYTEAIHFIFAPICLQAYWGRGLAYQKLDQTINAANDWANCLPFANVSKAKVLDDFRQLQSCSSTECHVVHAMAVKDDQPDVAIEHLNQVLKKNPNNRFAKYILSNLTNQPILTDNGDIPLHEIFPSIIQENVIQLKHAYFNIYSAEKANFEIQLTLSLKEESEILPQIIVEGPNSSDELFITNLQPSTYKIIAPINIGKNKITIKIPMKLLNQSQPEIFLHQINVNPKIDNS